MTRPPRIATLAPLALFAALLSTGCKKELPGAMRAVPPDADVVATLDAQATMAYAKQLLPKVVPAGMQDQIPTFESLAQQALQLLGLDIGKLTRLTFIGYLQSEKKMALIAEGLGAAGLKGEKKSDHAGIAIFGVPKAIVYAELPGLGLVVAPSEEMVKLLIDAFEGQGIGDTERGKLLQQLLERDSDLDLLRVYLLTGQLPDASAQPFKLRGGFFALSLDRGAAVTVVSDKDGVDKIAQAVGMGLMGLQASLALGAGKDMPLPIDAETKKQLTAALGKIKTEKQGEMVTLSYRNDLKPLLEKGLSLVVKEMKAEADDEQAESPPVTPPPAAAQP